MHPTVLLPSMPSLLRAVITRNGSYPNILEAKSSGGAILIRHKSEADAAAAPLPPPLRAQPPPGPGAAAAVARAPSAQRLIAARRPSLPSRYPPPTQATQQHPPQHPGQSPPPGLPPPESQHLWPQFPGCVPYPHWYEDRRILLQKAVAWHLQQEDFRRELRDDTSMTSASTLSGGGGISNAGIVRGGLREFINIDQKIQNQRQMRRMGVLLLKIL